MVATLGHHFFRRQPCLVVSIAVLTSGHEWGSTLDSAARATVVGVLVEVPVMLSVVKIANNSRAWYERGVAAAG